MTGNFSPVTCITPAYVNKSLVAFLDVCQEVESLTQELDHLSDVVVLGELSEEQEAGVAYALLQLQSDLHLRSKSLNLLRTSLGGCKASGV